MNWMPIPALGGVNLFDDPRAIQDSEVQWARNLAPIKPGILKKRGGLSRPLSTHSFDSTERPVVAMVSPISGSPVDVVVLTRETDQSTVRFHGVALDNVLIGFFSTPPFYAPRPHVLSWAGKAYLLPGPDAVWNGPSRFPYYVMEYKNDPASDFTQVNGLAFAGTGNDLVFPKYAFPYKQRLALANFGKGYENTIVFTDNFTADVVGNSVLASNGRAINLVAGADGDEIVGGIEVMLTNVGSPAESGLLLLRRYGNPFLLTGDMDQTTGGTSTLAIQRISVNCGCAGQYTVARTPVGIIWAGADDVWCFAAGVLPHRIGQKIQPALKLTPPALQQMWTGVYHDGFYRLAIWGAGQSFNEAPPGDQWWLDLRDGLPDDWRNARWWGPQQFLGGATLAGATPSPGIWTSFPETRAGRASRLVYVDWTANSWSFGDYGDGTRDLTSDPVSGIADADYVDPEVTAELITKEYALAPARDQINDGILFAIRPSNDLTLSVDFVLDDGDQVLTRTKRLAGPENFRLDSNKLDQTDGSSRVTGKAIKTALYPATRRAGQTHRFRLYDTAGYTIVQGFNDSVAVALDPTGATIYTYWVGTVAPGCYSISDLITAVAAAINAAKPVTSNNWAFTSASGVYSLNPGGPYGNPVNISVRFISTTLTPPDNGTPPTAAQALACRRLFGILGFDVSGNALNAGPGVNPTIAGSTAPFKKGISDWEIYGVAANMEVLPRTP